jgi:hypothetical protein
VKLAEVKEAEANAYLNILKEKTRKQEKDSIKKQIREPIEKDVELS